jgi:hypothetical protein
MQLLVPVAREQHGQGRSRQLCPTQPFGGAHMGQIEVQPKPPVTVTLDRLIDRQRLRRTVDMNSKRPHQPGHDAEVSGLRWSRKINDDRRV